MTKHSIFATFLFFGFSVMIVQAQGCEHWRYLNPLPQGNRLYGVEFDGDLFWAVGDSGTVMTSSDGFQWEEVKVPTGERLHSVAFDGNDVVIAGENGVVCHFDGMEWHQRIVGGTTDWNSVTYALGVFVCVGDSGSVALNENAVGWTTYSADTTGDFYKIIFDGTRFVAVGITGTIITSPDGSIWSPQTSPTSETLYGIDGDDELGVVVVVGRSNTVFCSQGGGPWTAATVPAFDGNYYNVLCSRIGLHKWRFMAVGTGGQVIISLNGMEWSLSSASGVVSNSLHRIRRFGSTDVILGGNGPVLTSGFGSTWNVHTVESPTLVSLKDVFNVNGQYKFLAADYLGGSSLLLSTPDFDQWTECDLGTTQNPYEVIDLDDTFIAVGSDGAILLRETFTHNYSTWPAQNVLPLCDAVNGYCGN